MIFLAVAAMALLGGTTWLALNQPVARDPGFNRRLTAAGLVTCVGVAVFAVLATLLVAA